MAVAAETDTNGPSIYRLVDDIPEVAAEREAVRASAWAMLDRRRNGEDMGSGISELIPVDALSTAHHVLEAGRQYGQDSAERTERWNGLVLDCRRLVGEWYRKRKPEYFEPLRHTYDPGVQDFFSHGLSIRQMTENALVPMPGNAEEEGRRVNERVEDATPEILRRTLGRAALGGQVIRTVSECTDWAIGKYQADAREGRKGTGYGGYVPEIAKVMVRDMWLDTETDDRLEEQIGLPGEWITDSIFREAMQRRNANIDALSKTQRHGSQFLAGDSLMEFVALLDQVASEEWCTNIFMGEEVPQGFVKDYAGFRAEALHRQESLGGMAETVATFVLDLAADGVDRREALVLVEEFVKKLLLNLAKDHVQENPEIAEQMFDEATAQGLQEVVALETQGRHKEAFRRMQEVEAAAPGDGYCGSGSCGLEGIDLHSDAGRSAAERLQAGPGDTVLRDKVRACKCGSKSVLYAYNKKKVNKLCESCGAFESKVDGVKVA
ncbi:MAG TPA: hypothetical protein VLF40_05390 [Candidatus Saccharimonadales bacterium]|nr:hypothetical protein [Candidatus Saccharimonadales bacterium]